MMRRLIVCAGMNRSGSTWQFNAVRALLREALPALQIHSCWVDDYVAGHPAPIHVVKAHALHQFQRYEPDEILTSYRDLRAVAGSLVRMGWASPDLAHLTAHCDTYVTECAALEQVACYAMRYEHLLTDPREVLRQTASALHTRLSAAQFESVGASIGALKPPEGRPTGTITAFDTYTLLHQGHVGAGTNAAAMQFITDDARLAVTARYSRWLEDHDYARTGPPLYAEPVSAELKAAPPL